MFYRFRIFIGGLLIFIFVACFGILYVSLSDKAEPITNNTPNTDLNSVFCTYKGKVYAAVPSNGYYEVKGADAKTFKTFTDNYQDAHIGWDGNHVYAGNIILQELNPNNLKALTNNYYTDGKTTYFCARNSERNEELGTLKEVLQLVRQSMGTAEKPQTYWYPFVELPKNQFYTSKKGFDIGGNAHQSFFRGQVMPKADPKSIRPLNIRYADRQERESTSYFTDGKNVYYENQLLPLVYNNSLFEVGIEGDVPSRSAYLIDSIHGMVYADGHSFNFSKAPYKMLSSNLNHANQPLFSCREGFYFYDPESEKIKRAGDNPFVDNQFTHLAPDVFASANKVYFLTASEHWGRKTGLSSRSTHLMALEDVGASDFKKLDNGENPYINIWQAGKQYFYLDNFGSSNLMSSAVYEIKDEATVRDILTKSDLRYDDIQKLRRSEALSFPPSDNILTSSVSYNRGWYWPYLLILGGGGIVGLVAFLLRNKKISPFILQDGYLMFNNMNFKRYQLTKIDKVIFSVISNYRTNSGYSGRMQIVMKNGKKSFNTHFSTKVTLLSESKETVKVYIKELQDQLEKEGVKTELVG
ncbi:DKNYY domain-containing protein [Epilithonimonas zeae]|uniref:DKNYY domain-containing protein n=1 Tax=Epilithonimonas zeae TaxID=1416779 RepID=UPI00200DACE5|nr:DKNYY domain-containing protein [Epilithonimonas zeae]UQB69699.1 DKNYY domain-containing protein [Epilithonimonas zeae]